MKINFAILGRYFLSTKLISCFNDYENCQVLLKNIYTISVCYVKTTNFKDKTEIVETEL